MTVLVTGASGLIGRHTLAALFERGEDVRTFQRGPAVDARARHWSGDVRLDFAALHEAAAGCRALVHLAGRGDVSESRREPLAYAELNAQGALRALEAARLAGAAFVLASSQRVYPLSPQPCREDAPLAPDSPYGYAKWVAELWCRMTSEQYGVPTSVLRFFSVYGPGQQANGGSGVVAIFARNALAGAPLVVRSAGKRDFVHARDVAAAIVQTLQRPAPEPSRHRVYNIATGRGTAFAELARVVVELSGSRSPIQADLAEPAGSDLVADISRAQRELGFEPCIELRDGVQRYIEWLRHQ